MLLPAIFFIWNLKPVFDYSLKSSPIFATGATFALLTAACLFSILTSKTKPTVGKAWILLGIYFMYASVSAPLGHSETPIKDIINLSFNFLLFSTIYLRRKTLNTNAITIALSLTSPILLLCTILTGTSEDGRFGDIESFHPNVVSVQVSIAVIASISLMANRTKPIAALTLTVAGLLCLLLLKSKTSIAALILSITIYIIFRTNSSIKRRALYLIIFTIIAASSLYLTQSLYLEYLTGYTEKSDGKLLYTFTGRTLIWEATLSSENLSIIGNGINAFSSSGPQIAAIKLYSAHNEILNQYFNFGIIGVLFFLTFYSTALLQVRRLGACSNQGVAYSFCFVCLSYFLFRSTLEAPVYYFSLPTLIFSLFFADKKSSHHTKADQVRNTRPR